jgi:hypothetical protein
MEAAAVCSNPAEWRSAIALLTDDEIVALILRHPEEGINILQALRSNWIADAVRTSEPA